MDNRNLSRVTSACVAFAVLGYFTTPAMANPGAAVAMASIGAVIYGTIAVCVIEVFVALLMKAKKRSVIYIPLINFISLYAGLIVVGPLHHFLFDGIGSGQIGAAPFAAWGSFFLLAVFGVFFEWPVFRLCVRSDHPWRRSFRVLLVAAGFSNLALALIFAYTFDHRLATTFRNANIAEVAAEHTGPLPWVYFIENDDRTISRIRLDGTDRESVFKIPYTPTKVRYRSPLSLRVINDGRGGFRLVAELHEYGDWIDETDQENRVVEEDDTGFNSIREFSVPVEFEIQKGTMLQDANDWGYHIADLREAEDRANDFAGLRGLSSYFQGRSLGLYDGMISNRFVSRGHTVLPGGLILFDFIRSNRLKPPEGIMLVSVDTDRRVFLLKDGWGPVVIYPVNSDSP